MRVYVVLVVVSRGGRAAFWHRIASHRIRPGRGQQGQPWDQASNKRQGCQCPQRVPIAMGAHGIAAQGPIFCYTPCRQRN